MKGNVARTYLDFPIMHTCITKSGMEANSGPTAGKFYVGPVEILNGIVKFPIASIQFMGIWSRLWDFEVAGPVNKKVSLHVC